MGRWRMLVEMDLMYGLAECVEGFCLFCCLIYGFGWRTNVEQGSDFWRGSGHGTCLRVGERTLGRGVLDSWNQLIPNQLQVPESHIASQMSVPGVRQHVKLQVVDEYQLAGAQKGVKRLMFRSISAGSALHDYRWYNSQIILTIEYKLLEEFDGRSEGDRNGRSELNVDGGENWQRSVRRVFPYADYSSFPLPPLIISHLSPRSCAAS